ncbi:MAG: hypothetical protein AUJ48_03125 [Deltaproteobacteria bacterium CG1_02_45_11]|nr:MAG: hypothetical protein AUJ48_03125 [Deltaproteobacteria bacterium CG1_02_45_11]
MKKIWIAVIFCGLLFLYLLGLRLDFFRKETPYSAPPIDKQNISVKETWMNIYQHDRKIGYAHRSFIPIDKGYRLADSAYLRINTMGMVQDVRVRTEGNLNSDLTLASFDFYLQSGLFHFKAQGKVTGKTLSVFIDKQKIEIPIDKNLYLTSGIVDAAFDSGLKPNQTKTFLVFDPASMGKRPVRIALIGNESLDIMGRRQNTKKISIDFMGASQTAWIAEDGTVVQEEGFMGILLKRVPKKEALNGLAVASQDLTKIVSAASNVPIKQQDQLKQLRLQITGTNDKILLNGGRQTYTPPILTILREELPDPSEVLASEKDLPERHLQNAPPLIQDEHPKIKNKVAEIVSPDDSPLTKAQKLVSWIYKNIDKRPVLSIPNALQTLENRMGDCNEHAVLLAAMARAADIPAQIEAGLVYMNGGFYYHAWNVLYLGRWITADSLMGQMPADVTHIRFIRGGADRQIDLVGVIGKVKIHILEQL